MTNQLGELYWNERIVGKIIVWDTLVLGMDSRDVNYAAVKD